MRLAVFASLVTPLQEAQLGGAQAFACDLADALGGLGHEVVIHCARGSRLPGRELQMYPGVPSPRALWRPNSESSGAHPELQRAFGRMMAGIAAGGYDAVSGHAFDAEAVTAAEGLPVLHTLHLPPPAPALLAVARSSGSAFVTVSRACAQLWRRGGLASIETIRNGSPDQPAAARGVGRQALIAGRVSPEKGTAIAIRVALRAGLEPRLVGTIYDHDYWRREVGRRPQNLSRTALWRLMARSAVLILPAQWEEPYGLVAAEAQLAGCPVAGYRRGGLAEVVSEGRGGFLVAPGDEDALLTAIGRALLLDRAQVRRQARRRLLIEPCARAYARRLEQLARRDRGGG
ncbi:MAG TPA: glycosyltransferase [Candidatus Nitrosotalea sp.]|nr:glycosyltransferase [Candidatus Nitrosotalea sp.]